MIEQTVKGTKELICILFFEFGITPLLGHRHVQFGRLRKERNLAWESSWALVAQLVERQYGMLKSHIQFLASQCVALSVMFPYTYGLD